MLETFDFVIQNALTKIIFSEITYIIFYTIVFKYAIGTIASFYWYYKYLYLYL